MMTQKERAKQFSPFDSLKGLHEALKQREERRTRTEKREISDEIAEKNSKILMKLEKGMKVGIFCYSAFHDTVKTGVVTKLDTTYKFLVINDERIWFDDIYEVKILGVNP